jgi:hypothetical protein
MGIVLENAETQLSREKAGACYLMSEPSYLRPFAATLEDFTSKMC